MKLIIAGTRTWSDESFVYQCADAFVEIHGRPDVVLSGAARGVDYFGELWAERNKIQIDRYPADWSKYGAAAGPRRNAQMASVADALLAIWDGKSPGTGSMVRIAREAGLLVEVVLTEG